MVVGVVRLLAVQGDGAFLMLAGRRMVMGMVRLLAVQSQRTLALAMMAMVNLVMAMMRRLPVMRMVSLVLAVQVHSRLLLLGIASKKNYTPRHVAEDWVLDHRIGLLHHHHLIAALFLGGGLAVVGVVDLVVVVFVGLGSVVVTGLEAEGGLLSLMVDVGGCHGCQEG